MILPSLYLPLLLSIPITTQNQLQLQKYNRNCEPGNERLYYGSPDPDLDGFLYTLNNVYLYITKYIAAKLIYIYIPYRMQFCEIYI